MATKSATAFVMLIATFLISLLAFASNNLSGGFVPHVAKADDHTKNANIRGLYNNNISNDNNKLRGRRRLTDDNDDEDDESSQLVFDSSTPEAAVESEEAFLADAVDTLTSEVNEKVLEENTLEPNEEDALNESVEELAEAVENLAVEKEELEEQEPEEGVEEMIITTVPNVNVNEGGDEEEEEEGQQQQEVAKQEDENSSETTAVFGGGGDDGENTVLSTPSPSPDVLSNEQDDASEEEEKEVVSTPNPTTRPTVKEESWYDVENSPTNEPEPGENNDEWGEPSENNDEWGESKDDDWGENGEDDEWGENGEDEWGGFSNLGPTDKPTPRPTAIYVPKEGDPLQSEEEPDVKDFNDDVIYHGLGGKVGAYLDQVESPQEMEYDKNVQITAGILGSLTLVILLVTAHLVMNHPDGLCAGCCRLVLKVICCFTRTLCLPCRAICCKGSEQSSGRRTHQPMRTPFPTDLELS